MNRKHFLQVAAGLVATPFLSPSTAFAEGPVTDPKVALSLLKEGNLRYIQHMKTGGSGRGAERRTQVSQSQSPYAAIVSCADSRVAPEVFFDSGIGELFVVRIAGNIVSGSNYGVIGSIEFAISVLKSPLIVVLGHENCGAVKAAMDTVERKQQLPGAIEDIVEAIRPAAEAAKGQPGDALHNCIEANVGLGMKRLKSMSAIISDMMNSGKVHMVGGIYDLDSGRVDFLKS